MGLDLKLLPIDEYSNSSYTILECFRRPELFDAVLVLEDKVGRPVSTNFMSYLSLSVENEGYYFVGKTTTTPYGKPLKFVQVCDLLKFTAHDGVQDNWKNRAVWAYLSELPTTTKVAPYWD